MIKRKPVRITEEEGAYIREHLPHSTHIQVAKDLGRHRNTVSYYAACHGIPYSKEAGRRAAAEACSLARKTKGESISKKISETKKEIFRKERMRVRWGLEQKTKYTVKPMPKRIQTARKGLKRRRDYIIEDCHFFDSDPYVIYYDSKTRRTPNEDYFAKEYGFKFLPLDD